jgi:peptidoglycan hydrolase CwlO-like protein
MIEDEIDKKRKLTDGIDELEVKIADKTALYNDYTGRVKELQNQLAIREVELFTITSDIEKNREDFDKREKAIQENEAYLLERQV